MDYLIRVNPITGLYEQLPIEDYELEETPKEEPVVEDVVPIKKQRGRPNGTARK